MSGVRDRPSSSLKLFSLGMVVVVVDTEGWGPKKEPSCSRQPRRQRPGVHQNLKGVDLFHDRVPALKVLNGWLCIIFVQVAK